MIVNISIDDVSPNPLSSTRVLDRCHNIISEFPDAKFTLFVPAAYWRTCHPPEEATSEIPYFLSKYPDFVEEIKNLSEKNFEIGYHGFYHGIPKISNNDEFKSLDFDSADRKFKEIRNQISLSNIESLFKPIFRPPAWKMSRGSIRAAQANGISVLALSPDLDYDLADFDGKPLYYNICPPQKPLEVKQTALAVYHACEWDINYLSEEKSKDLISFLRSQENIDFRFMGDI